MKLNRRSSRVVARRIEFVSNSLEHGSTLCAWLVCGFIALTPLQDTALQNTPLKLIASSLAVVPLTLLLILKWSRKALASDLRVHATALLTALYVIFVCAIGAAAMNVGLISGLKSTAIYGLLSLLLAFATFYIDYTPRPAVRKAIYAAFIVTLIGVAVDLALGTNSLPWLQATPNLSDRPRGFSTEASTLSVQIVTVGMCTAHVLTREWLKYLTVAVSCVLLVVSGSKGGLIALMLCAVVLLVAKSASSRAAKVALLICIIPFLYAGALILISRFTSIIEANETSTIATRLSMTAYAVNTVTHYPLGVGFAGFLPSIQRYLPSGMYFAQSLFPFPLWFYEVRDYLYPPQVNADCKTFFFDFLAFFGIPFGIMFCRFFYRLLKKLMMFRLQWLFVGVAFSGLALTTYYSTLNAYPISVVIGMALSEIRIREASVRLQ